MIRLAKSTLNSSEANAVSRVILDVGYLGMGAEVGDFEQAISKFLKTDRTAVCVNTGTSALHLAVEAVCPPNSEVLVPSLTYVASFQAIAAAGCRPIACDVDRETGLLGLKDAESRITKRTKAIMPVHYAGVPADMNLLATFAKKHNLRVIEDAAHAFGSSFEGRLIGSIGDITCFSFDGIKNITSGEGGAILSSDPDVIARVRDARLLGVIKDSEKRLAGERSWEFDVQFQGYRYHMSNLFAAIGLSQLAKAPDFFTKRQQLTQRYYQAFKDHSGLKLFALHEKHVVPHIYPIRVLHGLRDRLRETLLEQGIETGIHYFPNHRLSLFKSTSAMIPVVDEIYPQLLSLPLHPGLTEENQESVISAVEKGLQELAGYSKGGT